MRPFIKQQLWEGETNKNKGRTINSSYHGGRGFDPCFASVGVTSAVWRHYIDENISQATIASMQLSGLTGVRDITEFFFGYLSMFSRVVPSYFWFKKDRF
jgi:hypothetical protein